MIEKNRRVGDGMIVLKIVAVLFTLVMSIVFAILSRYFGRSKYRERIMKCINWFSVGLFIGVSFLELMP